MTESNLPGFEWVSYKHEDKMANPLPVLDGNGVTRWSELCWVYDEFYLGVTLARWTQNGADATTGWWEGIVHGDDIGVSAWRYVETPEPPSSDESRTPQ